MMLRRYHKQRLKEEQSYEQERQTEAGWEEGHEAEAEQENQGQKAEEQLEESLEDKKVPELKELAKEKGIEGFNNMKKEDLIKAIEAGD